MAYAHAVCPRNYGSVICNPAPCPRTFLSRSVKLVTFRRVAPQQRVLFGKAPPRGPTHSGFPFIFHFDRKDTPLVFFLLENSTLSHTYLRTLCMCMGYWPSVRSRWLDIGQVLLLRVYGPKRSRGPKTRKKKEQGQYQAMLTERAWSIKDFRLYRSRENFSCWRTAGNYNTERARWLHLARSRASVVTC